MILAWLAFFDGSLAVALALAGMVVAHYDFAAPIVGFTVFAAGLAFGLVGVLIGLIATLLTALSAKRRAGLARSVVGLLLSAFVVVPPAVIVLGHPYPPINDITTDTSNPPEFTHAQELAENQGRDMTYPKAFAAIQESAPAYQKLGPEKLDEPPDEVFKKANILAGEVQDWRITYVDPKTRSIEGVATSMLFHFKDDFVIQIRPAPGGGSLVEMRSKSRVGKGDLGTNYNRIMSFMQLMKGSPRGAAPNQQ
ncbi:MAG TPA: DUF1499 domain-containing protein [Candidatus Binataceae bacterium]|nr:DUF1499 domain-containing protein [Candidatus Binataceae bacterium]